MRLHYRELGKGPHVILLHGVLGSSVNWQSVAKGLADDFRVVAADLRNHGRSPHHPAMTYAEMVGDLVRLMDHLGLERSAVLGHSMGGKVAMAAALQHPGRVTRLVVADMAPVAFPFRPSAILDALLALDLDAIESRREADQALVAAIPEHRVRAFLLQNLERTHKGYRWRINLPAIKRNSRALADFPAPYRDGRFEGPVLFLRGEHSDYVQDDHATRIRELFPAARIQTLAGTGHWLHAEAPRRFITSVREFLGAAG